MPISVPFLTPEKLREIANEFLRENHSDGALPIPIEHIVEYNLHLNIVPVPSLMLDFNVDGFLSKDLTTIFVDSSFYHRGGHRYRFTLAHEAAHLYLHTRIVRDLTFSNVPEWKDTLSSIPDRLYTSLEWQANALGGLILVPPVALEDVFRDYVSAANEAGIKTTKRNDSARNDVEAAIANVFDVSPAVVSRRVEADELWGD